MCGTTTRTTNHNKAFSSDDTHRALDTTRLLLDAISAPDQAATLDEMRNDVMRLKLDEQARCKQRQAKREAELKPHLVGYLSAWRESTPAGASGRSS